MKISKILCGALLGCIVGSAFGVPTPEDRKEFCRQHLDKLVWVEKTKACIPINPCVYDDEDIRNAYCIKKAGGKMAQERYIKNFMPAIINKKRVFGAAGFDYVAYYLADGDYKVFEYEPSAHPCDFMREAVWAYGHDDSWKNCVWNLNSPGLDANGSFEIGEVSTSQEYDKKCKDIADFAGKIGEYFSSCEGKLQSNPKNNKTDCKIICRP